MQVGGFEGFCQFGGARAGYAVFGNRCVMVELGFAHGIHGLLQLAYSPARPHIYRAIIEGLAYGLKDGLDKIERASGKRVGLLAVSGGASQSDQICQISADVFDLPIVRGKTWETSGLGAAMCAAAGLGWYPSVRDASLAWPPPKAAH